MNISSKLPLYLDRLKMKRRIIAIARICASQLVIPMGQSGVLPEVRFRFSVSRVGPEILHFSPLPGDVKAVGLWTTF